jgi:hypothetical protein
VNAPHLGNSLGQAARVGSAYDAIRHWRPPFRRPSNDLIAEVANSEPPCREIKRNSEPPVGGCKTTVFSDSGGWDVRCPVGGLSRQSVARQAETACHAENALQYSDSLLEFDLRKMPACALGRISDAYRLLAETPYTQVG